MGSKRYQIYHEADDGVGWLVYGLGIVMLCCFLMATSLYCGWPFGREDASRWVALVRSRVRSEMLLHFRSQSAKAELAVGDQWKQVDLQFSLVESFLTEDNCKQSRKSLAACVATVNRLLDYNDIPSEFIPGPSTSVGRFLQRDVQDFGFAHVRRRLSNSGSDLRLVFAADRKTREEREVKWSRMRLLNDPMPFEDVARWLRYQIVDREHESEITAVAYNTYLNVARDPHTQILPIPTYQNLFGSSSKRFSGLGVEVKRLGDNIYVSNVADGTPADRAGIRSYDILSEVNGYEVQALTMKDVLDELGSTEVVKLKVMRAGRELSFTVAKVHDVPMRDVENTLLNGEQGLIGYVKVSRFSAGICQNVRSALEYFNRNEVRSILLDLRNNTGGDLGEGICLTGLFLDKGQQIVRIENLASVQPDRVFEAKESAVTDLPLFVLVNARTASASEIFAGTIQAHHRGFIVGQRTFGKGTTQIGRSWSRNADDPANKKFLFLSTLGRFLLPSGSSIQVHGVLPEIPVYSTPWPTDYDKFAIREEDHMSYIEPTRPPESKLSTQVVQQLASCKYAQEQAAERYDQLQKAGMLPDHVLISAQYWARCLTQKPHVQSASAQ